MGAELRQKEQRSNENIRLSSCHRFCGSWPKGMPVLTIWGFGSVSQSISSLTKAGELGPSGPPLLSPALFKHQRFLAPMSHRKDS